MKKEPYFGSVRFFKNMILLAVILMVLIPTVMVVVRGNQLEKLEQQEANMRQELEIVSAELLEFQEEESKELGVDVISYQTMYPDFYAPEPLTATEEASKVIYLTFDDGPSERTVEILEILREKNVKATFFVIGRTDEDSLNLMKEIVEEGAISYRTPMEVTRILKLKSGNLYPVCPRCKITVDREYMKFCDRCGQRLDWRECDIEEDFDAPQ